MRLLPGFLTSVRNDSVALLWAKGEILKRVQNDDFAYALGHILSPRYPVTP